MLGPLLALALLAPQDVFPPPERLSVLVVSGANNHDWMWTSVELAGLLEQSGRFRAEVTPDPAQRLVKGELLEQFDAIVLDYNGPRWGGEAEAAFLYAVHEGLGVVVVHAADNAFPGWIEYEELVGLCWRERAGHGKVHPFDVEFLDRAHPISATLPGFVDHPDELYHGLTEMHGVRPRVLGSAFSSRESGGTGQVEPVLTVTRWGAGRVAHTTLGHVWPGVAETKASLQDPQLRELLVRMTEWVAIGEVDDGSRLAARPHELERELGWKALIDDGPPRAWRGSELPGFPKRGWGEQAGALRLRRAARGGDLVSEERFSNFEVELEWQVGLGGSSGLLYRMEDGDGAGLEYQLVDDERNEEGADPRTAAGALWGVVPVAERPPARPLRFRNARVVALGPWIEHWLDGRRVVSATLGTPEWRAQVAGSVFAHRPLFGTRASGRFVLQDRGDELWLRAMRVRDLDAPAGEALELFDHETLGGWEARGDAEWTVEERALHGRSRGEGGAQSFLLSERELGDCVLVLDVRALGPGNSGIQLRSRVDPDGVVRGPQIEIDPSERAFTGGLYDEGGRGWIADLAEDRQARAAFVRDDWNRIRVECVGPWIRAWVNGVPTCDVLDAGPLAGRIGVQVHAGAETDVLVDLVEARDLGTRSWETLWAASDASPAPPLGSSLVPEPRADLALRILCTVGETPPVWRLDVRADPDAPSGSERRAPGLLEGPRGWTLDPADLGLAPGRHELRLALYGRRIALHVDGARAAEIRGAHGPESGLVLLRRPEPGYAALGLERLEILGQPER